jgi:hypothetical protein
MVLLHYANAHHFRLEDPTRAKQRPRRLVLGMREVKKGVKAKKIIAVIVSPNIESLSSLDERVNEIIRLCQANPNRLEFEEEIPVLFTGCSRKRIGKCLKISRYRFFCFIFAIYGSKTHSYKSFCDYYACRCRF